MEKKKMGRPTEAPKVHGYRLRMTDEELALLEECARLSGMSKADAIREGLRLLKNSL